jgi:hypothetical protein
MPTFFIRKVSGWSYADSSGSGFSLGDFYAAGASIGQLRVIDPTGRPYVIDYIGAGAGVGLGIKIPMKIAGSKLLGISVKGLHKPMRKAINTAADGLDKAGKIVSGGEGSQRAADSYAGDDDGAVFEPDPVNDKLPDWAHPSGGIIFVGADCKTDDLQPADLEGLCIWCNIDLRLIFGSSGAAMLFGLDPAIRPRLERIVRKSEPLQSSSFFETMFAPVKAELVAADYVVEVIGDAKGLIFFGGASFDLGAGGSLLGYIGTTHCRPELKRELPEQDTPVGDPGGDSLPWL